VHIRKNARPSEREKEKKTQENRLQRLAAKGVLSGISDVEEAIFVFVLLIDRAHQSRGRWQHLVDEDEDRLLWRKLDPLADDVDELTDRQVRGDQVFFLIDGSDIRLLDLLADNWNAVGVFLADALGLGLALLEGVLVLELAAHFDGVGLIRWIRFLLVVVCIERL